MYQGWTRLLIVFLTHPGILMDVPATGIMFLWARGLLQAAIVLVLHLGSEGKMSQIIQYAYWLVLMGWAWIKVEIADKSIV
jgi:hypothetical protein